MLGSTSLTQSMMKWVLLVLAAASQYVRAEGLMPAYAMMAWVQAGAHQLPRPGEDFCERLVPVEKLRQLSLELIQAGFQCWHARMHSRHPALQHTTSMVMPWGAMARWSMPCILRIFLSAAPGSPKDFSKPQP